MNAKRVVRGTFLSTTALGGALLASVGLAQDSGGLEEVVVTATRTVDTANRVPLTIAAVTQETMDQQGIKNAADLVRFVPALNAVANLGGAQQTFSIRGIVGGTGAATTSVYLDDTNLTKRANGGVAQNNGVILPVLYDLERVEVLKGPQGTLYGGSSEGGTVRYITPTPSLTEFSGSARAEGSTYGSRGETSSEFGFAVGGPIVADKLGFRVSGIKRTNGGWVDVYSAYTGQLIRKDANSTDDWAVRAALLWQFAERGSAMVSLYHVDNEAEGGPSSQTALFINRAVAPAGQTWTVLPRCVPPATRTAPLAQPGGGPAASFIPANSIATGPCPAGNYVRPGNTYGPFVTGKDISLATGRQAIVGTSSDADIGALTLNYDFDAVNVKSITSYLQDTGGSNGPGGEEWNSTTPNAGQSTTADSLHKGFSLFQPYYDQYGEGYTGTFIAENHRHGIEEEFRVSSTGSSRLSWVAGAFFSKASTHILYRYLIDPTLGDAIMKLMYGPNFTSAQRYGVVNDLGFQARLEADIKDEERAVFGEANFWIIPDRLKAIAGLRYSQVKLDYFQTNYGQFSGRLLSSVGTVTQGNGTDKPLTPKFGLQYQIADAEMIYASAGKGFRAGGVNAQISQTICQTQLDALGITAAEVPTAYNPDTVWSYELGGKFRIMDKLQINVAVYRIDWEGIQATTTLSCGQGFTTNGGKARSRGAELQAQYRPIRDLNFYLNAGYTEAYYIDPVTGPRGATAAAAQPSFNSGDRFDIAPFQMSFGGNWDFMLGSLSSYLRLDASYQRAYNAGPSFGSSGYGTNYFTQVNPSRQQLNLRTGVRFDGFDINLFVQNLTNENKKLAGFGDGRGICSSTVADCSTYTSYSPFVAQTYQTPRKVGVQVNYKF